MKYLKNWNDLKKKLLEDHETKAEYDRLGPEFELIKQKIIKKLKRVTNK